MPELKSDSFALRVYAEDTDFMGIVFHSCYLSFFERARTEMFRKTGLSLTTLAQYDCQFAIHEVKLRYLSPARLDDLLTVVSQIKDKKPCSIFFEQFIYNEENKLLCEGEVKIVCVNRKMQAQRIPQHLLSAFF